MYKRQVPYMSGLTKSKANVDPDDLIPFDAVQGYYGANTQKWKLNAVKSANDTPTISSLNPATIDNGWYSVTSSANSLSLIHI